MKRPKLVKSMVNGEVVGAELSSSTLPVEIMTASFIGGNGGIKCYLKNVNDQFLSDNLLVANVDSSTFSITVTLSDLMNYGLLGYSYGLSSTYDNCIHVTDDVAVITGLSQNEYVDVVFYICFKTGLGNVFSYYCFGDLCKSPVWLQYLESDGTQYIDTGWKPNNDSSVRITANPVSHAGIEQHICGVRENSADMFTTVAYYINNYSAASYNGNAINSYSASGYTSTNYLLKSNTFVLNFDFANKQTTSYSVFECENPMYLFGSNESGTLYKPLYGRIYSCQCYDRINGEDVLTHDLRPCLHPYTLVPCMYDTVTYEYLYNKGNGDFKYEYNFIELDCIESDKNQKIPLMTTHFTAKLNIKLNIEVSDTDTTKENAIIGTNAFEYYYKGANNGFMVWASSPGGVTVDTSPINTKLLNNLTFTSSGVKGYTNTRNVNYSNNYVDSLSNKTMYLFAYNNSGTYAFKGKLYYVKVTEDDIIACDCIPVRKNDGTICLYDFITGSFKTNTGTGNFKGYCEGCDMDGMILPAKWTLVKPGDCLIYDRQENEYRLLNFEKYSSDTSGFDNVRYYNPCAVYFCETVRGTVHTGHFVSPTMSNVTTICADTTNIKTLIGNKWPDYKTSLYNTGGKNSRYYGIGNVTDAIIKYQNNGTLSISEINSIMTSSKYMSRNDFETVYNNRDTDTYSWAYIKEFYDIFKSQPTDPDLTLYNKKKDWEKKFKSGGNFESAYEVYFAARTFDTENLRTDANMYVFYDNGRELTYILADYDKANNTELFPGPGEASMYEPSGCDDGTVFKAGNWHIPSLFELCMMYRDDVFQKMNDTLTFESMDNVTTGQYTWSIGQSATYQFYAARGNKYAEIITTTQNISSRRLRTTMDYVLEY